jgi:hypothetical protein
MYALLKIESITETRDPGTGEVSLRASVSEVLPRRHTINLSKKTAEQITTVRGLEGQQVMLPVEEGFFEGRPFMRLLDDPIIEVPNQGAKEKIVQPVQTESGKNSLFSSSKTN